MPDTQLSALLDARPVRLTSLAAGWTLALAIAVMTWGPLKDRPQFGFPQIERFAAYLVLGALLAAAYPRRPRLLAVGLAVAAVALEIGQGFVPHRDPGLVDAIVKALGAVAGVGLVQAVLRAAGARRATLTA
ncbi:MAG: hypothetical protein JWO72_3077 [Caulobacteraceae bacterium]|nr:hypothetical protein [Caulobacteraceae bacterium]